MKNIALLDALATRRMFVLYRVESRPDGKTDKLPTHPWTGDNINGQDSAHWLLPHEALSWANQWNLSLPPGVLGYGVGLVLYEGCGIFALDFDHCRDANGGWLPHVINFENRFPGAYRETSFSKTGRHVFGTYTGRLSHGTRNKLYRMESYTKLRFMGLTGEEASGSVLTDCTVPLSAFLGEFFPEHPEPEHGVEWTTAPVASWRGPADDGQLIARAIRAVSPRAVFGGGAAFSDLWNADAEILGKAFPVQNNRDAWDRSAADQALANHLAFWTGNDCERMVRIMYQSQLVRDKWNRPDYLPRTILDACGTQREWYSELNTAQTVNNPGVVEGSGVPLVPDGSKPVPSPPGVPPPPGTIIVELVGATAPKPPLGKILAPGELPLVGEFCNIHMMRQMFDRYCYVQDIHAIQLLDGSTITKERFDTTFGGPKYALTVDGQQPTKSAWDAFTLSEIWRFPRVETQYFKPGEETGVIRTREGRREINSYRPANVRRIKGDPAPFIDLVQRMLPEGRDAQILLSYMAACCRYLGTKFAWCVFLQGCKGNGKTTVAKVLEYCLSYRYTHWAKADQLGEKFNSVFVQKLLVIIDEMYSDDTRELQEILKQLVTALRIEVRPMYAEKMMKDICFNMFLISNHQNGVRIDLDERRYAPLFCAQQSKSDRLRDGLDNAYFIKLQRWLWDTDSEGAAIVYDFLMDFDIPDEFNPTVDCIVAPFTTSTELAATASLGGVEQELMEAIRQEHEGFRNGWISSQAVDFLLARCGRDKAIPRNGRKALVTALGYIPHPSLGDEGALTVPLADGARPRLYVTKGHAWAVSYLTPEQVRQGFVDAQKRG